MNKIIISKSHSLIFFAGITVIIFIFSKTGVFKIFSSESINEIIAPIYYGLAGLLVSIVYLNFFKKIIFESWLRRVGLWFIFGSIVVIGTINSGGGFLPSYSRSEVALFLDFILFIITLIYAPVMHYRLKSRSEN